MDDQSKIAQAKKQYSALDVEGSKRIHNTIAAEKHAGAAGQYIKSIVYGGLDGIITTFAVVASIAGAGLEVGVVIIMGFASLFADGISMGMGDFLSSKAENDYTNEERKREEWECEHYIEGEINEMVELYVQKGMSREDAERVVGIMSQYRDIFVDTMMVEELGLSSDDPHESPIKNGLVTLGSFLLFGCVPMVSYVIAVSVKSPGHEATALNWTFFVAAGMTLATMFLLGALTSKFSPSKWYVSGMWILLNGGAAAVVAYFIGWGLGELVGEDVPA
jgi:VIT1/CCC1 family predicted Fe2+/Mn2+ transporter